MSVIQSNQSKIAAIVTILGVALAITIALMVSLTIRPGFVQAAPLSALPAPDVQLTAALIAPSSSVPLADTSVLTDLVIVKSADVATAAEGDTVVWTITVSDTTTSTPVITDVLPLGLIATGLSVNNVAPNTTIAIITDTTIVSNTGLVWQPLLDSALPSDNYPAVLIVTTTVATGASSLGTITNTAIAENGTFGSGAITVDAPSEPESDFTMVKSVFPANPAEGDTVTFTITITDTLVSRPIITDVLPAGLSLLSYSNNNTVETTQILPDNGVDDRIIVWQPLINSALPSSNYPAVFEIVAEVDPFAYDTGPEITNVITADNGATASAMLTVADPGPRPSLDVGKTVLGLDDDFLRALSAGEQITYQVVITNDGAFTIVGTTLADPLIDDFECSLETVQNGETVLTPSEQPMVLTQGQKAVCLGQYRVTEDDKADQFILNTVGVSGITIDGVRVFSSDQISSSLKASPIPPDLTIMKTVDNPNPQEGETVNFNVILTNTVRSFPVITDILPEGLTLVRYENNNANVGTQLIEDNTGLIWSPEVDPTLTSADYPAVLTITARVSDGATALGTLTNIAWTDSGESAGVSLVLDDSVVQTASMTATKEAIATDAFALDLISLGKTVTYSVIVTNDGDMPLNNIVVTDDVLESFTCTPSIPAVLLPGSRLECIGDYIVTQADIDREKVVNTAVITATTLTGDLLSGSATTEINVTATAVGFNSAAILTPSLFALVIITLVALVGITAISRRPR